MATEQNLVCLSKVAGEDLSAKQYFAVTLESDNTIDLADAAGEKVFGVLQNNPAAGQVGTVAVAGVTKMIAGGVIAVGGDVAVDADGKAKAAVLGRTDTTDTAAAADPLLGSYVFGMHVGEAAAAAGDIISVLITHTGSVPTTVS
jgi:hypothetical protein